jgi:amino acid transporter
VSFYDIVFCIEQRGQIFNVTFVFGIISLMGAMLPLPRVIYAMASDGIIFRFLGKIHPRFQTPLLGTLLAGLLTGTIKQNKIVIFFTFLIRIIQGHLVSSSP